MPEGANNLAGRASSDGPPLVDPEKTGGLNKRRIVQGYPYLAFEMGKFPETGLFRRFSGLNMRNLLYLQAELARLEKLLQEIEEEDSQSSDETTSRYCCDWFFLYKSQRTDNGDPKQGVLLNDIQKKLRIYNEALIQQSLIAALPDPDKYDIQYLQHILDKMEPSISGPDSTVWGSVAESNQHAADLIALSGRHKEDIFSKWVTDKLFVPFDKHIGKWVKKPDPRYNTRVYNDNFFLQITHLITSLIACSLPVTSIVILYFVTSMRARLAIVAGFNLLFTTCLFCLTTAKRNDIFAATAAFAAVQVVFIGTNVNNDIPSTTRIE